MKIDAGRQTEIINQLDPARKIEQYKLQIEALNKTANKESARQSIDNSFEQILKSKIKSEESKLKISKHAQMRADERGIHFDKNLVEDISSAVEKARGKGVKDLAIISEKGAFVVNVTNNVVITSMNKMEMKDNIFTNISGAVIL